MLRLIEPIEKELVRAATTLRHLPIGRVLPPSLHARWPDVIHDFAVAYGRHSVGPARIRPSARDIERMDVALGWLLWIDDVERKIVWARATGSSYRKIARLIGCSHATARIDHLAALLRIAQRLLEPGRGGGL